uniref:Flowering time control protein FPA n=1 Tax=Anthurium amnicola TaxID=1678845 RepID=A0A1D1ZF61_9ARAE
MPPPGKPTGGRDHHHPSGKEPDDGEEPSGNLWVGNLPPDTVELELAPLFAKYGALDGVSTYAARNYAFVHFKHPGDAKVARGALQGALVRGNPIKIDFARPAKPGKNLWIGGFGSSVTKEQLEVEFSKFGKIEEYKFFRDRNFALVNYHKIDDAIAALKSMNGRRLGSEQIRVDYLRSQTSRRDWSDHHDARDGRLNNAWGMETPEPLWMPPDSMRNFPEDFHRGHKRLLPSVVQRDGPPSKILWIGYPPSFQIDDQMLHNAMILFGEIEHIKSFPSRHYSLVEFRSIDEARRAKEGLQGRLFNDPRIQILFANRELVPLQDNLPFFPGPRGPRPDMFFGEHPFGPMEPFGPGHPMAAGSFPGMLPPSNMPGSNMLGRPFAPQGFDHLHGGSEFFNDVNGSSHLFPDGNVNNPLAANYRRLSPAPGTRPPIIPVPGMWDGLDVRDPKRLRIDGPPIDEASFRGRRMVRQGVGEPHVLHQPGGVKGSAAGFTGHNEHHVAPNQDHLWHGIIAKGGTPVCHARCLPMGKVIASPFPEVVNCSARTGLDMLTKHYAEAVGFDVVFFLPDSEDDFASYTEFLRYLGLKNRAGVAKLDDGTTLFLVPPSDFLSKVLKVSGPERLYGIVLKMPQQMSSAMQQSKPVGLPSAPRFVERQQTPPPQTGYSVAPWNEDQTPQMEFNSLLPEESLPRPAVGKPFPGHGDQSRSTQAVPLDHLSNPMTAQPVEVSLTPELIATLASVIPTSALPSSAGPPQLPLNSSAKPPYFSVVSDKGMPPQIWSQEPQALAASGLQFEQPSHHSLPLGHQFGNQTAQLPYTNIVNMPDPSGHVPGGTHVQDNVLGIQQAASISTMPFNNYVMPPQSGQISASQTNPQNQVDAGFSSNKNYGVPQPAEVSALLRATGPQQPNATTSSQVQSGNVLQHWVVSPLTADNVNADFPTQVQQLQNAITGSTQVPAEGEADKNQRYQSTLQLAASLLLQIQQQQQQQANAQAVQGSGNQQ